MIDFLEFMLLAVRAWRGARRTGSYYAANTSCGVPCAAIFVGLGREAWRVSQRAIREFENREC